MKIIEGVGEKAINPSRKQELENQSSFEPDVSLSDRQQQPVNPLSSRVDFTRYQNNELITPIPMAIN
ncbi:MAG: hypothetical protein HC890_05165 [Chloroflexaceae bacterium]|nr:hypothetical protein [Chloroflexaceae bacterium]